MLRALVVLGESTSSATALLEDPPCVISPPIFATCRNVSKDASAYLRIDALRVRIAELEIEISKPDLWDDQERAKQVNTEYSNVKGDIDEYESLARAVEDVEVLHELAREEDDSSQEPDIEAGLDVVSRRLSVLEMRSLFTGEHDESDAIVQVNAKDGVRRCSRLDRDLVAHVLAMGRAPRVHHRRRRCEPRNRSWHLVGRIHHQGSLRIRIDDI